MQDSAKKTAEAWKKATEQWRKFAEAVDRLVLEMNRQN